MRMVENVAATVEQTINPIDWIPIAASFSGMVRILAGMVQVAAGMAFAAFKIFSIILTGRGRYEHAVEQGIIYSIHGIGNIVRGVVAMMPFLNMSLYVYDKKVGRMNYEKETMRPGVYPIMTAHRLA